MKKSEFILNKDVFAAVVAKFELSLFWGEPMRLYQQAEDKCVKFPCLEKAEIMSSWKDHEIRKKSYMHLIPLEKIHSSRDSVRKARESHLIDKAMTLEPHGLNRRDELL